MLPRWIKVWFAFTIPVVVWDAAFVLSRPDSLPGGSIAWIWSPYHLYLDVDRRYLDLSDTFVIAQSCMNLIEAALGGLALYLASRAHRRARLVAFSVALMTLAKTVLYFMVEAANGFANIAHAEPWRIALLYATMNGVWIVVPAMIVRRLGREIT